MPFRQFLSRIRSMISLDNAAHYDAIARDLEMGLLRQPAQPMTDSELAAALAEFVAVKPSDVSRKTLNDRLNPQGRES